MTTQKIFHAVADDTALISNISELKKWIAQGNLTLTIPIYTLERLHLVKRDASQIGINAREAVKFLDKVTSSKDYAPESSIQLQGPDEQYATWDDVEAQLEMLNVRKEDSEATPTGESALHEGQSGKEQSRKSAHSSTSTNALSQALFDKLNSAKEPEAESSTSTPPTSPSLSNLQSAKTSPEVNSAELVKTGAESSADGRLDAIDVPHPQRPLINSVVFLLKKNDKEPSPFKEVFLLTNDDETATIVRSFSLAVKNIHQLRSCVCTETQEAKNQSRYRQKHSPKPSLSLSGGEAKSKTLFSYEDDGEDDELVFRPRTLRHPIRGRPNSLSKDQRRSVDLSKSVESPVQQIDPDSFDRGMIGRTQPSPAVTSSLDNSGHHRASARGSSRGSHRPQSSGRGMARGNSRSVEPTPSRGRGRLFIP